MPSYVHLMIPLAMLAIPLAVGRWLVSRPRSGERGWATAAIFACVAVGLAMTVTGWPPHLSAAESATPQTVAPADDSRLGVEAAEAVEAGDAREAAPAEGEEPASAQGRKEPASEQETGEAEAESPAAAPEGEQPAAAAEGQRIESWWQRSVFNLFLLAALLAVLIGPFRFGLRLTRQWRQPLWGWPIGLVVFAAAAVAVVTALRWVFALLPPVFGSQFESYVDVLASLWRLWTTVLLIAVPVWLGAFLSRKWRMPDYSGRIAVVVFCLLAGVVITVLGWPPKFGIDLKGGVILVYELQDQPGRGGLQEGEQGVPREAGQKEKVAEGPKVDMDKLVQAIRLRADPGAMRELTIRPRGDRQIEVIIPLAEGEQELEELQRIKRKISSAGTLEFRILANRRDHESLIERALQENTRELYQLDQDGNRVLDRDGRPILLAWWVPVKQGREEKLLEFADRAETVYRTRTYRDYQWTEFLVVKDIFDVNGSYLVDSRPSIDQSGRPNVLFTFNHRGGQLFGGLTGNNLPDEAQDFSRHLGILLDGYLQSAPSIRSTIFERGEITGDFTRQEVEDLVDILNAGSLPTALSEQPVSETQMGPGLGQDTIDRGRIAITVSVGLVLVFMVVYYRFAGLVACMALVMNLVMILAIMISVRAAFTLPGLAGLVLTVGMAVDANVLIFERIREELGRQAKLRMAIRNGFARATSAIVDANLTTLITATVLYVIGTDQIKGFAVTLWLGVVLSMFTAIYCSRVVFDVAEKQKWITRLAMLRILRKTQIDFLGMRRLATAGSILVIVIGLVAVWWRGSGLLDIDFTGGVSIHTVFNKPQDIADIRAKLGDEGEGLEDLAVRNVIRLGQEESGLEFIINTSGPRDMAKGAKPEEVRAEVERRLVNAFGPDLARHAVTITPLSSGADVTRSSRQPAQRAADAASSHLLPTASLRAGADLSTVLLVQAESAEAAAQTPPEEPSGEAQQAEQTAAETASADAPSDTPTEKPAPAEAVSEEPANETLARLDFEHKVSYENLSDEFENEIRRQVEAGKLPRGTPPAELFVSEEFNTVDPDAVRNTWFVRLRLPPEQGQVLLDGIKKRVESEPVFPSSNTIGGQVARGTRVDAVAALLASLVFIVGYIWIRFQRVTFGLAAVVALVHDVLVTLGVIALTAYLAPFLGFLLIEEFKIGLPVLAAFLTIIGYSLNDTIVVFDRIREVRGKAPQLTGEMINTSINQTLSRTLLTSLTTLLVVVVLYVGGGQGVHVFAFALVVGVVVGTYSSIFVASPVLFWMTQAAKGKPGGRPSPQTA